MAKIRYYNISTKRSEILIAMYYAIIKNMPNYSRFKRIEFRYLYLVLILGSKSR